MPAADRPVALTPTPRFSAAELSTLAYRLSTARQSLLDANAVALTFDLERLRARRGDRGPDPALGHP